MVKCKFYQKVAKICDIKKLKTSPWLNKFFRNVLSNPNKIFGPWVWKDLNNPIYMSKKLKKVARFVQKMLNFVLLKSLHYQLKLCSNLLLNHRGGV